MHYFLNFNVHSGQNQVPTGALVMPTQLKWNHSTAQDGLSHATILPNSPLRQ